MSKRLIVWLLLALIASACTSPTPELATPSASATASIPSETPTLTPIPPTATLAPTDTPIPTNTPLPVVYGPDNFPTDMNPLTGMVVSDPALLDRRPLSVKVQLFPRGQRPPFGITQADVVYDYYQNNGLTRLHAIFYGSNAAQVGPIRSGRLLDSQLVTMYNSVLAFGGADRRILDVFYKSTWADRLVFEGSQNCPPMCRVDPNGYNFLVTDTTELSKYITEKGISNTRQNLNGMVFHALTPAGGQPGQQFSVRFSISAYLRWDFDPASGRYLRFQDTQEDSTGGSGEGYAPLIDQGNGQQIAADNVVVLLLPHLYAYQSKSGVSEIVDIQFSGTGMAYAFRDGQIYSLNWSHASPEALFSLTFSDGADYPLKPGITWFEVIGQSSQILSVGTGIWRFQFAIP
ncbi:MAG: DUF3048 domain-containing protein [Anaerolineales bacterium]|nr:DUF3048 domain-containing protein [Anaerolineales bacterium]